MVFNIEVKEHTPANWASASDYPGEGFYKVFDGVTTIFVIVSSGTAIMITNWEDFQRFSEDSMADVYPGEGYVPPIKYKLENSVSEEFVLELMDKVINGLNDGQGKQLTTRKG